MEIINSIFSWIFRKRMHQIELFLRYPHEVQQELLMNLLQTAKNTEWGKLYGFEDIKNYQQFVQRIPVQDYIGFKKDIIRLKHGEQNILWPTEIKWFAKSSGTTAGKSKFIPVSREALEECHFKAGKDMLALYFNNVPASRLFSGRHLVIGGSHYVNQFSSDSYYGDLSSILIENLPFWVNMRKTPGKTVALLDEWEQKIEKMALETSKKNVTNISGVPSWTLILLRHILEITGKKYITEVWPNLELFVHGGVAFTPYADQFHAIIPNEKMNYMESYNASEGFFAIQDFLQKDELLLMLDYGIFYEFIPMDDISSGKTIPLDEVKTGQNYAMVITTNAGLWRYQIGDTVTFTSLNPYRIKVSGRIKHFINAFGEELIVDNAERALKIACEKTNALIKEYTAGPMYMGKEHTGRHEWLIEFEKEPDSLEYFTEILDNALKSINSDYEAKRYKDLVLQKPLVHALPANTFYSWLEQKGKLGGQNKVPRLSNDRTYPDEILSLIGKENKKITSS